MRPQKMSLLSIYIYFTFKYICPFLIHNLSPPNFSTLGHARNAFSHLQEARTRFLAVDRGLLRQGRYRQSCGRGSWGRNSLKELYVQNLDIMMQWQGQLREKILLKQFYVQSSLNCSDVMKLIGSSKSYQKQISLKSN